MSGMMSPPKTEHMTRAQYRQKQRDAKKLYRCFVCGAMIYPRVITEPKNEREKKAVFCPSCNVNLTEMAEAVKSFEQKLDEQKETEQHADTGDKSPPEHEPGVQDGRESADKLSDSEPAGSEDI